MDASERRRSVLDTPTFKQEKKIREKEFKKTTYYKIISKNPKFLNPLVSELFSELPKMMLKDIGDGRKKLTHCNVSIDNCIYIGEVNKKFMRDGLGHLVSIDGSYYEGYFSEGSYEGKGRLITECGDVLEGTWKDKVMVGDAMILTRSPYSKYNGEVEDSLPEGHGRLITCENHEYQGSFHLGKKEGLGVLNFSDGSRYEGEFKKDKQNGKGTLEYKDGTKVVGNWVNNKLDGIGTKNWPDGKMFEGEFKLGVIDGKGKMTYPDLSTHEGYWVKENPHGIGISTKPNGQVIKGQWNYGNIVRSSSTKSKSSPKKIEPEDICENIEQLEQKAYEIRKKMDKNHAKNFKALLHVYEFSDKLTKKRYEKEIEEKQKQRLEVKIKESVKRRKEYIKIIRREESLEEASAISHKLATFEIPDFFEKFERLLKKREELEMFDYYDPDSYLPEEISFHSDWIEVNSKVYYRGEVDIDLKPAGRGILVSKEYIYEGFIMNGLRHGLGREITKRAVYIGYFVNNAKQGFGVKFKKESTYTGDFMNDLQSGDGCLITPEAIYSGGWSEGKQHGEGVLKFKDGKVYSGNFHNGVIQGYGSIRWKNGKGLMGIWENGEIVGKTEKIISQLDPDNSIQKKYSNGSEIIENLNQNLEDDVD